MSDLIYIEDPIKRPFVTSFPGACEGAHYLSSALTIFQVFVFK